MILADKLTVSYGAREIFHDLTFTVADGEKVGLVGANGAGKTTLLRILAREIESDRGKVTFTNRRMTKVSYVPQHLTIAKDKQNVSIMALLLDGRGLITARQRLQEIETAFTTASETQATSLLDEYQSILDRHPELERNLAESEAEALLVGVGLNGVSPYQSIQTLSGGQKSRLMLARMLYEGSDILLLDEPTNHLDEEAINWLAGYLAASRQTVIVISHQPFFLDRFVTRIMTLDGTLKSYPGNYTQYERISGKVSLTEKRKEQKTSAEISRLRRFIKSARQSQANLKHDREKRLEKLETGSPKGVKRTQAIKAQFNVNTPLYHPVFAVNGIAKSFGDKHVLLGVTFELGPTDRLSVIGENGAGKTTLLRILAGDLKPDAGTIWCNKKLEIGWYRQEQEGLDDNQTIYEEAKSVGQNRPDSSLRSVLAHFLFPADRLNQTVGTLSRGERSRLVLSKLVLCGPNLLLLDEPTNHLDPTSRKRLIEALADYQGAMVVVSHNEEFIAGLDIHWAVHLHKGRAVMLGADAPEESSVERKRR